MKTIMADTYCPLPFNHVNIHPNGRISICCVAEMGGPDSGFVKTDEKRLMDLSRDRLDDMFNSNYYEDIRTQLMSGEQPSPCHGCYKIEREGGYSRRLMELDRWGRKDKAAIEFIDLRLSNLCNLKCMMCYPSSSSALTADYNKWSDELPFVLKSNRNLEAFQWFDEDKVEQLKAHKDTLKYLYINGGEPFIMDKHWYMLEKLIEWGVAKNITISYNTNCTTYEDSFGDYWKHFRGVNVGCSIDAVGDKNKFIRYPADWDKANDVIVKLANNPHITSMNITNTIQWLNAPFLDEFYEWALPLVKIKHNTHIVQNFLVFPHYLSLNCASLEFKTKLKELYKTSKHRDDILTVNMVSYLNSPETNKELWDQGIQFLNSVSKTRRMNWREVFNYDY